MPTQITELNFSGSSVATGVIISDRISGETPNCMENTST